MQMRAGRLARVAALPDAFTSLDLHSFNDSDGLQVGISCLVTESVVYQHGIAIAEEYETYAFHYTVTCGIDRITRLQGEVDSLVERTSA